MTAPKVTAAALVRMIRARHEEKAGWAVYEEVPAGTGFSRSRQRFCDVLALQTFPSRGIGAHGYEVKVSRADLVAELRDPTKAHAFQRWCDAWWLAVPDESLITGLVLPATWGVLIIRRGKLHPLIPAPTLTPEPWDKPFCAAIARAYLRGMVPQRELDELRAQIDTQVDQLVAPVLEARLKDRSDRAAQTEQQLARLLERVEAFEVASGVKIDQWHYGDVGAAVRGVMQLQRVGVQYVDNLRHSAEQLLRATQDVCAAIKLAPEETR